MFGLVLMGISQIGIGGDRKILFLEPSLRFFFHQYIQNGKNRHAHNHSGESEESAHNGNAYQHPEGVHLHIVALYDRHQNISVDLLNDQHRNDKGQQLFRCHQQNQKTVGHAADKGPEIRNNIGHARNQGKQGCQRQPDNHIHNIGNNAHQYGIQHLYPQVSAHPLVGHFSETVDSFYPFGLEKCRQQLLDPCRLPLFGNQQIDRENQDHHRVDQRRYHRTAHRKDLHQIFGRKQPGQPFGNFGGQLAQQCFVFVHIQSLFQIGIELSPHAVGIQMILQIAVQILVQLVQIFAQIVVQHLDTGSNSGHKNQYDRRRDRSQSQHGHDHGQPSFQGFLPLFLGGKAQKLILKKVLYGTEQIGQRNAVQYGRNHIQNFSKHSSLLSRSLQRSFFSSIQLFFRFVNHSLEVFSFSCYTQHTPKRTEKREYVPSTG